MTLSCLPFLAFKLFVPLKLRLVWSPLLDYTLAGSSFGGLCFHLCTCKSLLRRRIWRVSLGRHNPERKASYAWQLHSWNFQDSRPFPPRTVNIRFSWGGQKGHFPNRICSQALSWITQLIHSEATSWADLRPFWQERCWFRLTRGHCLSGRMASSLLGEQNQVWEQKTNPTDSLQLNPWQPRAFPNSLLSRTKPLGGGGIYWGLLQIRLYCHCLYNHNIKWLPQHSEDKLFKENIKALAWQFTQTSSCTIDIFEV